jgi:hypothetical protein
MSLPTPHGEKLKALLLNEKLPQADRERVAAAVDRYAEWVADMEAATGDRDELITRLVDLLNDYRL